MNTFVQILMVKPKLIFNQRINYAFLRKKLQTKVVTVSDYLGSGWHLVTVTCPQRNHYSKALFTPSVSVMRQEI